MHILIFGHGYSAAALTPLLTAAGWQVSGTSRSDPARVAAAGAAPLLWPGDEEALRAAIDHADAILIGTAPGQDGVDPVLAAFSKEIRAARPRWLGYLSSTNIYGDHGGGWVDEDTPPRPSSRRAQARLAAERAWTDLARDIAAPLTIFRLAGIYGPGRGPIAKLRAGTARRIVKPDQVFSRIHVEDIAGAVRAALDLAHHQAGGLWVVNLCDNEPLPPEDAIAVAAEMLGLPVPPPEDIATAEMSPMARSFYADSKRVRNDRLRQLLGYRLRYPDLCSGLAAIIAGEDGR
ncbi:MAG: SDR family oxidoreductase [Paracoccus sp. (in: a-proteobacteria)]